MSISSEDNPVSKTIKDNLAMEPRFKENSDRFLRQIRCCYFRSIPI